MADDYDVDDMEAMLAEAKGIKEDASPESASVKGKRGRDPEENAEPADNGGAVLNRSSGSTAKSNEVKSGDNTPSALADPNSIFGGADVLS